MAIITRFIEENLVPIEKFSTQVVADYTISDDLLRLRTYKSGDTDRAEGTKQNIQLTKDAAFQLKEIIDRFLR